MSFRGGQLEEKPSLPMALPTLKSKPPQSVVDQKVGKHHDINIDGDIRGTFRYDRKFLLQLLSSCIDIPENYAMLEARGIARCRTDKGTVLTKDVQPEGLWKAFRKTNRFASAYGLLSSQHTPDSTRSFAGHTIQQNTLPQHDCDQAKARSSIV
ncbi:hypothetical protein EVG20_g11225 [Dentipellis fragilis]|uniref:Eukaryotic translation initiation factor 4G1 eIF4E-binding domain-containing protein n=1 Tax=Dentipellis fragilis TaxID=205917 RepID=A0A4Y9XR12_9AGAM|nr:hypothetical protein EVG20_g11225 [Dentipellis fragilis]